MANNVIDTNKLLEQLNTTLTEHLKIVSLTREESTKFFSGLKLPSNYIQGVNALVEGNNKISKSQNEVIKTTKKVNTSLTKSERDRLRELKLAKKREQAFDKYDKQLQREQKQLARTQGLYNRVQRGINKVTQQYNNLALKKELNGKLNLKEQSTLTKLEAKLVKYQGALKNVDARIGKHQRNVGNYKSGFDGLGNSIAQLSREMPAFANSMQTGFMAISNNLPIFFDEISRVRKEVKGLRADGKQTAGVMSRLATSFFSLQTLLSVGVTLLTLYGKDLVEWASSAFTASGSADKLAENTKKINKESAELSSQTIPQFKALVKIATDVTETEEKRALAIKKLNNEYPDFNTNILNEKNNTNLVNKEVAEYINKIGQKAKAQASMNMMQEKYNELILLEQEIEQKKQAVLDKANENRKLNNKELFKTQKQAIDFYKKISKALDENSEKGRRSEQATNNYARALDALDDKNNLLLEKKQEINDLMDVYVDNVDLSTNKTNINNNSIEKTVENLENKKQGYNSVRLVVENYIKQLTELRSLYADNTIQARNLDKQINALKNSLKDNIDTSGTDDINEFIKQRKADAKSAKEEINRLKSATQAYLASFSDDFIRNSPLSSLMQFADGTFGDMLKNATPKEEFALYFNAIAESAQQAFAFIDQLGQQNFNAQYERLEQQKAFSLQFAGEGTAAREEIERQYEERRAEIQRKQAKAEKSRAIFNSIVNTAQAVVSTLAQAPGGAISKGLQAAIVGGLGAAQTALIASQPIPQFWQGGVVGGSQQIMVNDDPKGVKGSNYKEVIEKPNGQILTPQGKNVKMTLPKGTIVHPTYDAFMESLNSSLAYNNITPIPNISPNINFNGLTKSDVMEVMQNHAKALTSTINNQNGVNVSIDDKGLHKYVTKGSKTTKVLNARFNGKGISV